MTDIVIFGRSYGLPSIKDERFLQLQQAIQAGRERIGAEEKPKGLAALFARREDLGAEERLALMEELAANYDELIRVLREKIEACREVFGRIGEGVEAEFASRLGELEATEKRRLELAARIAASGRPEAAEGMADSGEAIRGMVKDLSRSTILIVRKLRQPWTPWRPWPRTTRAGGGSTRSSRATWASTGRSTISTRTCAAWRRR